MEFVAQIPVPKAFRVTVLGVVEALSRGCSDQALCEAWIGLFCIVYVILIEAIGKLLLIPLSVTIVPAVIL